MTTEANYHEFTKLPEWTRAVWEGEDESEGESTLVLVNDADPYKWSGYNDPPKIGAKVKIYMNNFGAGKVVGYFAEYGWLGVLVKLSNPPSWWRQQTRDRGADPAKTNGHFFGLDLEPRRNPGRKTK
jgi:hypothetical protein